MLCVCEATSRLQASFQRLILKPFHTRTVSTSVSVAPTWPFMFEGLMRLFLTPPLFHTMVSVTFLLCVCACVYSHIWLCLVYNQSSRLSDSSLSSSLPLSLSVGLGRECPFWWRVSVHGEPSRTAPSSGENRRHRRFPPPLFSVSRLINTCHICTFSHMYVGVTRHRAHNLLTGFTFHTSRFVDHSSSSSSSGEV